MEALPLTPDQQRDMDAIGEAITEMLKKINPIMEKAGHGGYSFILDLHGRLATVRHLSMKTAGDVVTCAHVAEEGTEEFIFKLTGQRITFSAHAMPGNEMEGQTFVLGIHEVPANGKGGD